MEPELFNAEHQFAYWMLQHPGKALECFRSGHPSDPETGSSDSDMSFLKFVIGLEMTLTVNIGDLGQYTRLRVCATE